MSALLLTGVPGVGKTTVLRKVVARLTKHHRAGFVTEEIRGERGREGFRLITMDGQEGTIAHAGLRSRHRVGKYGVDVATIDRFAASALSLEAKTELFLVDEIGKMECLSEVFLAAVRAVLLDCGKPLVATIAKKGEGFIAEVKRRRDCVVWEVTRQNRDTVPDSVLSWIEAHLQTSPNK